MVNHNRKLIVQQLDRKIAKLDLLKQVEVPVKGWINAIRTALNMSLVQLARRLKKTSEEGYLLLRRCWAEGNLRFGSLFIQ